MSRMPFDENIPGPYGQWGVSPIESIVHRQDPQTSKDAARSITDSGKRKSHNEQVAWAVARYPGMTASELSQKLRGYFPGFSLMSEDAAIIETRRRLSDMNGIHVRRGEKHEARMGLLKNKESIWWPK